MALERFPRHLIRKIDNRETFPLIALEALRALRVTLEEAEAESIHKARELGATAEDIALALGITRQGVHYKLKQLERRERSDGNLFGEAEDVSVTLPEVAERRATED